MLEAHLVVGAVVATFEGRPEALHAVGVDFAPHVFTDRVLDGLVVKVVAEAAVGVGSVGEHSGTVRYVVVDEAVEGGPVVASTTRAVTFPSRDRAPTTAAFPTGPRPARSFLDSCLLRSLPPM